MVLLIALKIKKLTHILPSKKEYFMAVKEIYETITLKKPNWYIRLKTAEFEYWGGFKNYNHEAVTLMPYHTNNETDFHVGSKEKKINLIDITEIIF